MTLETLTDNQRQILISLPYRAGLYVSQSDQSGGDEANDNELRALENLIYGFSDGVFGSEFTQNVMAATIQSKGDWASWAHGIEQVPAECSDALVILSSVVDHKERNAYAARIMDIGEAVALAFREDTGGSFVDRIKLYFEYLKASKRAQAAKLPKRSFEDYQSISADERVALNTLAQALQVEYI